MLECELWFDGQCTFLGTASQKIKEDLQLAIRREQELMDQYQVFLLRHKVVHV